MFAALATTARLIVNSSERDQKGWDFFIQEAGETSDIGRPLDQRTELDLSRFDAAPLIAFIAAKEMNYGTETDGRIPPRCCADCIDKRA
ncbi:hypothetical protein, partial [Sulfitobacter sp. KE42]|uniref:hypothetical protein n=1 Tax=Sulfitobacter sp. KE42 TaxID=2731155 RepID=UPI003F91E097